MPSPHSCSTTKSAYIPTLVSNHTGRLKPLSLRNGIEDCHSVFKLAVMASHCTPTAWSDALTVSPLNTPSMYIQCSPPLQIADRRIRPLQHGVSCAQTPSADKLIHLCFTCATSMSIIYIFTCSENVLSPLYLHSCSPTCTPSCYSHVHVVTNILRQHCLWLLCS